MSEKNYNGIIDYVLKNSGIVLGSTKSYLIESRLAPIAEKNGYVDLDDLEKKINIAPKNVRDEIVDAMTTNESFFFRDNTPFDNFENAILPELITKARAGDRKIRIWCAAASTGQEPYSLAMILLKNKRHWAGLNVEILATDLSQKALDRAKTGKYTQFEVQRGLPVKMLMEHFTQDGTNWIISDQIKNMVQFKKNNLLEPLYSIGKMDLVFCRNVLIYFDVETKAKVVEAISKLLNNNGFMVLGGAETLLGISERFDREEGYRGLYRLSGGQAKSIALSA